MAQATRIATSLEKLSALGRTAAEMAFYFSLSFVPFLGLTAVAAVAWLPASLGEPLAGALAAIFPAEANLDQTAMTHWVRSVRRSNWVAAGLLLATWSSFRFMSAGVRALAELGGANRLDLKHRLRSLASALLLMILWMLALLASSFVLLAAPGLRETLLATGWITGRDLSVATLVRALAAVILFVAIIVTYRMIPGLGARGRRLWIGAVLATAGWIAVAEAARTLLPALWSGQNIYGALGSFVLFLLWCWANAWVLLACGVLAGRRARR
jgi:membrane protein